MIDDNTNKNQNSKKIPALKKTWQSFRVALPIIVSVILIVSVFVTLFPKEYYRKFFSGNFILDSLKGAVLGSVSLGNPIVSYVIGGGLVKDGVSIVAVAAFIISWVTVGIIQLPAEYYFFGVRFAVVRNVASFIGAILIGMLTYFFMSL